MTTKNLLISTLLATSLTLGASSPVEFIQTTKQHSNSISTQIAVSLHARGIEEETAHKLSQSVINTDEELFAYMVKTFSSETGITMKEISYELGKMALNKKRADFSSYSFLIKLSQNVKSSYLTQKELHTIRDIATKNSMIYRTFS